MYSQSKLLISTLSGVKSSRIPFWFMRQAGRFLPEYRKLRSSSKSFLDFCYTPDMACEATLQPINRFGMDAAIIFSDILVIPNALGVEVSFEAGEGPRLSPTRNETELSELSMDGMEEKLAPVYEALKLTKSALPEETALIGFAGSPWTLACYMVDGRNNNNFEKARRAAKEDKVFFGKLISLLSKAIIVHLDMQVKAGAEVVQIFDSWAGLLPDDGYQEWVIDPTIGIVAEFKKLHPDVPIIGFPRQSGNKFARFAKQTTIDAVSFDGSVSLDWVRDELQKNVVVQGALSNELLAGDQEKMMDEAKMIVSTLKDKPFVFNLAHGILPHTPIGNVEVLCEYLKHQSV